MDREGDGIMGIGRRGRERRNVNGERTRQGDRHLAETGSVAARGVDIVSIPIATV